MSDIIKNDCQGENCDVCGGTGFFREDDGDFRVCGCSSGDKYFGPAPGKIPMSDKDKLRADLLETIADAIADEWSARPGWHQHCAAAALTAIESAGYADASAVWDQAVEACAQAIKEVEKELAAEGEVYILLKTVEALRSLKRSDKESGNG